MTKRRTGRARPAATRRLSPDRHLRRRRGRRAWLAVAAVLVILALAWADRRGWLLYSGGDMTRYDGHTFVVERVIDGDTLIIRAADGRQPTTRVRLWGIDCPEVAHPRHGEPTAEPWARQARDRARQLARGERVYLELEPHRVRGTYGRILAFVRLPGGTWLNEQLLVEGLALADDRWPHRFLERYELLEMHASKKGLGLWGPPASPTD